MKQKYTTPELEITLLLTEEILTGSLEKDDEVFEDAGDLFG